ncbi:MAG: DUF1549 domain-containing protein [Planctomycetota bacterium]|nr:DUF1549 domain-containing protein [Planctomycetota bacterium]MDA0919279.1 DUF1549 domain-containing protein [Planctomycetota bacterium]
MLRSQLWTVAVAIVASVLPPSVHAQDKPISLEVYPAEVHINTMRDRQSFVAQVTYANGLTLDVTKQAKLTLSDAGKVKLTANVLHPVADGESQLTVEFEGLSKTVPIKIEQATTDRPVSFKLDIMPIFMKANCNTGSCHGAARGKDGFRLSLFGFDPDGDHYRISRELPGRRMNLALPEESLLMTKSVGSVPHTGGKRFGTDTEYYATMLRWLQAGGNNDVGELPQVLSVELYPPAAVLDGADSTQQLTVRAKYSDGTDRDVTNLAVFLSNNDTAATVSPEGLVTAHERGESFIMARFETHTVGRHFITLPKGQQYVDPKTPEFNFVDTLIYNKLRKLRITPSGLCSDEEFLRRAHLDIVGVLPTVEEYARFMEDKDEKKREKLVDELLNRKEFVEVWVMKWAELLQIRTTNEISYKSMLRYYNWLQERIASNMPTDQMVRELLGSSGGTFQNAATNYYQNERDTLKTSENVAQVFMGMRIQCAQCHNHPFDRWTMDDYYSFAAFFSQIGRKRGEDPRELIIYNSGGGDVRHLVDNRVMAPKFLGGEVPDVKGKDRRVVMADWLASPQNPYFATNLANIVWAHFFGKGIIDQVDDVRVSNPPVNKELLEELGRRFTEYNYDFKKLVRDICVSRVYQHSTATNETNAKDDRNFSHAALRRVRAEVLLDAITQVTDTKNKFQGLPTGARAVQIANGNTSTYFLTAFGRAKRETVCSCEVSIEPNLSQALHLLNGDTVNAKMAQGKLVPTRLAEGKTPEQVAEEIYIRCLSRRPTDREQAALKEVVDNEPNKQQALEDIFWATMNSREFVFNH